MQKLFAVLVIVLALSLPQLAKAGPSEDAAVVRAQWEEVYNSGDADKFVALYTKDAALFGSTAQLFTGSDGVRAYYGKLPPGIKVKMGDQQAIAVGSNVLLSSGFASFTLKDGTVVIVQVGFSTNLARLLDSPPDSASPLSGRELAAKKVRLLVAMAGNYVSTKPEFNVETDVPSASKLFAEWPTPIVVSGYEVGESMLFPATSIEHDFAYVPDHPVAEGYRLLMKMPYDRPTWDLTAALYAVWPDHGFFDLSPPGRITVLPDGGTKFNPDPKGNTRYLIATAVERPRTLETMILLASQPPEQARATAAH